MSQGQGLKPHRRSTKEATRTGCGRHIRVERAFATRVPVSWCEMALSCWLLVKIGVNRGKAVLGFRFRGYTALERASARTLGEAW